jgi:hypothetical protein
VVLNEKSLKNVHEFADIARPIVAGEFTQERPGNGWHTNPEPGGESRKQELNQTRNVFPSISKRWHFDANHIQPKEEISSKTPSSHLGLQVAVRRRDNPSRHRAGLVTPNPLVHLILQDPKKFGLQRETQFADLIQKKGPARRGLESPDARRYGAREGAALMSEELAFD